jgi:two-component system, chemotaxis family, sensor kinase CheA
MDDLLSEFLTETNEHLDVVDVELVRFEQDPNNEQILRNIFRLVHTIKGTCGFLGLPRLEALAHAAENLMGKFRDGHPVTSPAVSLILVTLDRIKSIMGDLAQTGTEPDGQDQDLIVELNRMADADPAALVAEASSSAAASKATHAANSAREEASENAQNKTEAPMVLQILERPLLHGEISLDELERAFRDTPGPEEDAKAPVAQAPVAAPASVPAVIESKPANIDNEPVAEKAAPEKAPANDAHGEGGESRGGGAIQTIRVNVDTLEHLMTMVSELVLTRNQLLETARRFDDNNYKVPLQRLSHVTAELQDGVMKTRMQPIGGAWQKLPRVIRDLSNELGKQIDLVMIGAETELDRQVLEVIKDPLTHMVRNSADHGIETPEVRLKKKKPEKGTIRLSASHEGGTIIIEIADDGRGLNIPNIKRKALERNLATEAELDKMTDAQVAKFIFHAGFSTAEVVTSVSGRGVGMDVVKTNIELIGGTIDIRTEAGLGTTFTIKMPLTLAIVAALIVSAGEQRFAIPQVSVLELVRVKEGSEHTVERINGTPVMRLRDRLLPIVPLKGVLGMSKNAADDGCDGGFVVVTQVGRQHFGMLVDGVFHTEEIVVKPMSKKLRHVQLFSGNTILGDGAVVLIVDPSGVARTVGSSAEDTRSRHDLHGDEMRSANDEKVTLLVFRAGDNCYKAVPLSLVTRLEEVDCQKIEWVGGRPLLQYRGRLMPLVPVGDEINVKSEGMQPLVVFSEGDRAMGLVVDEIVDIVEDILDIELSTERPELVGSAVIRGRATEIVNIAHYLPLAYDDWLQSDKPHHPVESKNILLVDGSAFFRDMLSPVLKAAGYRVITASSSDEAMRKLTETRNIALVVTDMELSGKSGFDLIAEMRAVKSVARLPVVMLSSQVNASSLEKARQLNVNECVAKFDRTGLLTAITEIFNEANQKAA